MRVLLPLRKAPANNYDSSCSYSSDEEDNQQSQIDSTSLEQSCQSADNDEEVDTAGLLLKPFGVTEKVAYASGKDVENSESRTFGVARKLPAAGTKEVTGGTKGSSSNEAGLRNTIPASLKEALSTNASPVSRKRKSTVESVKAVKASKKGPALDQKPAARDLSKMVSGSNRRRMYNYATSDDSLVDTAALDVDNDPLENDPASAHGNPVNSNDDADNAVFAVALKKRGLEIREQDGDGNCLFRAVSLQVYGDPSMHNDVRQQCLDFMERDQGHFAQFVTGEPFDQYISRKRQNGVHGNNPEIQAISELFNRPVEVFCPDNGAIPLNIFHAEYKTADAPIRLSYHDGNHYNAVVDPLVPTAGLGLGLPGLQPGLADKMQVARAVTESDAVADQMEFKKALKESEDDELQRAIKESKLSAEHMHSNEALALSDMDATYFELEQAALERSLQSYTLNEHGKKQKASSSSNVRRRKHGRSSPERSSPCDQSDFPGHAVATPTTNSVASLPTSASVAAEARIPPAAAAAAPVASAAAAYSPAAAKRDDSASPTGTMDEYPQTVQELVMNGFPLNKVVHAYEIIGDDFDSLLTFLMSNSS